MNKSTALSAAPGLVTLNGVIRDYRSTRAGASFVFDDSDKTTLGVVAVAAAAVGLSGQAVSAAASATSAEEDADYVEFQLDGQQIKGWMWRSPFKEGDEVRVAAQWSGQHYEAVGIARPSDRLIALYPHCSRSPRTHIRNAVKWWFIGVTLWLAVLAAVCLAVLGFANGVDMIAFGFPYGAPISYAFFGLMTFSLSRKWMPFARLTEKVGRALGLPNPEGLNLVRSAKAQRKPEDSGEYGTFYFRY
ncbi:putative type VI secretion system effector [Variovorax sp. EBFNA2]|uniref:putative type VI secretion system effector n=1 Tax=Variovorax sp. EBFNA2 TaxID=3342097 RepID=UPI0029C08D05|nr:putative type VI secretion system effector [Variovorax boronicumulans]WPG40841.1 putative type VI secretion system effector [Variovorax boronicumulans]